MNKELIKTKKIKQTIKQTDKQTNAKIYTNK